VELQGKTAVITGGASGIGLATARQFARSGVNLVLGDIEEAPLKLAVEGLRADGANVIGVTTDVSVEQDVVAMRDAALQEFGAAHIIFNNAGVGVGATIGTPKKVWDWVMAVNVDGVINGINAFVPMFLEQNEGHVINTGSLAGLGGVPGMGAYCASKFAVVGISECLFHEFALSGKNVGVSALCPGFVRTRINESYRNMPKELLDDYVTPSEQAAADMGANAVANGIEVAEVATAVEHAVRTNSFWILTHQRSAVRTTELRAAWMQGGPPPRINLEKATKS
jgi:NAD(P)-dependent dehydrogenase (short-subunit alcohol dehydrogenase family)